MLRLRISCGDDRGFHTPTQPDERSGTSPRARLACWPGRRRRRTGAGDGQTLRGLRPSEAAGDTGAALHVSADKLDAALDELLATRNAMTRVLLGGAVPYTR